MGARKATPRTPITGRAGRQRTILLARIPLQDLFGPMVLPLDRAEISLGQCNSLPAVLAWSQICSGPEEDLHRPLRPGSNSRRKRIYIGSAGTGASWSSGSQVEFSTFVPAIFRRIRYRPICAHKVQYLFVIITPGEIMRMFRPGDRAKVPPVGPENRLHPAVVECFHEIGSGRSAITVKRISEDGRSERAETYPIQIAFQPLVREAAGLR